MLVTHHSFWKHAGHVRGGIAVALSLCVAIAQAQSMSGMHMSGMDMGTTRHSNNAAQPCTSTQWLGCASTATPYVAPDGRILLTWIDAGAIEFAQSSTGGASWSAPIKVGDASAGYDGGGDARPTLVADAAGHVLVAYDLFKDKDWNARILLARSADGGHSFLAPQTFEPGAISQRLPVLTAMPSGVVLMAWQDKRLSKPGNRPGASIAYSWSHDGGMSFSPSLIANTSSCECCRIGATVSTDGWFALAYRSILPDSVRDHQSQLLRPGEAPAAPQRIAIDDWATNACPHHGPSVAISPQGTIHVVWYTQGKNRKGLFYARSTDAGAHYSPPQPLGDADRMPARPFVLAQAGRVWRVWKEFDGKQTQVLLQSSSDDGVNWSAPKSMASATGYSDHPLLVGNSKQVWLSWLSREHGYQLIALP